MGQSSPAQSDMTAEVAEVRAELERERKVTASLLRLVASSLDLQALMQEATLLLRDWAGCEAVGIRLVQDQAFPYFETRGFPPEFVSSDRLLCEQDAAGNVLCDELGDPLWKCTCGDVLRGQVDLSRPEFTPGGSFWTNSTTLFLASVPETERPTRILNRCNDTNYESVAMIPLRSGDTTYGLLQLNDRKCNRFTRQQVLQLEELARALAEAVARRAAMDETRQIQQRLNENEAMLVIERDLATALGSARTVDDVLEPTLKAALAAAQMDAGGIYLMDDVQRRLQLVCHAGVSAEFVSVVSQFDAEALQTYSMSLSELTELTTDDLPHPVFDNARREGFQSIVAVPVSHEGVSIATLSLGSRERMRLSPQARHTLTLIASLLGATLARIRADEALRQSQNELRAVYDHSPIMMCVLDAERRLLYLNYAMSQFFSKPEEELRMRAAGELLSCASAWEDHRGCGHGESCQVCSLRLAIGKTLTTGETCQDVERRLTVHREFGTAEVTLLASTALLQTAAGPNLLVCLQDITERKAAEEKLREQAMVLDQISDCVTVTDLDGRITYVNEAACRSFQRPRDEMVGLHLSMYGENPARGATQQEIIDQTKRLREWRGEVVNVLADGQERLFDCRTRLVVNALGEPVALCGISTDITDKKQAEESMREREARYRAVVETCADGFWLADLNGNILEANATYARLSGYSQEELISMHIADLEAMVTRETVMEHITDIVRRSSDLFETQHRAKDGTVWDVQISVTYWPFAGGRLLVFLRDVRRRSRSDGLLRTRLKLSSLALTGDLHQLMQTALDEAELYTGSRIGFFHFVDDDQRHLTLQAWSTRTTSEYCRAEALGLHYDADQAGVWADCLRTRKPLVHNDYLSLPHRKGLPTGHADVRRELVVPVLQGTQVVSIFGVGNKATDYVDEDVEVVQAVASMAMDIVFRKRAEEQLRLSEERFRRLFESMEEGCYLADAIFDSVGTCIDWRFLNVNVAFERLVGLGRDELLGRRMSSVFPQLDSNWCDAHVRVIATGQPTRCEGVLSATGGYYVAHLFSPDCGQVAAIISDNTRRRADENRLAELQLQLHHTSRLATMGELAAGIAHDVNQPLCSIANFANACRNLASSEPADLQQIGKWCEAIVTSAARAGDIVRRLLGYARRTPPERRHLTIEQLLADALLLVQHEARANRVSIRLHNEDPLLAIEVQTVPIQQVMVNLLRNGIDALQNTERSDRHIHVHATRTNDRLHIAVADNGTGIPTHAASRIFEPFFTTKSHGLGLGLAISRTIVEDHGGSIWATNNDEGGLTVFFTLPTG